MTLISIQKFLKGTAFLLFFLIYVSFSGCKDGYDDYWPKNNPKTGFVYTKIKADPNFSIFAAGLERADLVRFVNTAGLYTVFAPTNEAFQKYFTAKGYNSIKDVPINDLFVILSYHITNNMWYYYDFKTRFNTAQKTVYLTRGNKFITIDVTGNAFNVNGIPIVRNLQDIDAENGVIHGINEMLIPMPTLEQVLVDDTELVNSTFYKLMQVLAGKQYDRFNSYDMDADGRIDSVFYKTYPLLQNIQTAIEYATNTAPESQGGDPVLTTILIPSNATLNTVIAPVLVNFGNDIKNLPRTYVEAVLESYFIEDKKIAATELISRPTVLKSINNETVPALPADVFLRKDLAASNGMIHMINIAFPASDRLKSVIGTIMSNPDLSDFVEALQQADLLATYAPTTKVATFFAPSNAAFAAAGLDVRKKTLNGVVLTAAQFINIMRHHIIATNLARTALTGSKVTDYATNSVVFTTTNNVISVKSSGGISAIVGDEYRGATGVTNGYLYKIDAVLLPAIY